MPHAEISKKGAPVRAGRFLHPGLLICLAVVTGGLVLSGAGRLFHLPARKPQRGAVVPTGSLRRDHDVGELRALPVVETGPEVASSVAEDDAGPEMADDEVSRIRVDNRSVAELLSLARATTDPWLKAEIIEELTARRTQDGATLIVQFLHDADPDVRRVAVDALAELEAQDQVPAVRALLAVETNREVRAAMDAMVREVTSH